MLRLLAIVLPLTLLAQQAHACSCVPPRLARAILPADGTDGFPIDGTIRVFLTGGFPVPLRATMASEYRLRDEQGMIVTLSPNVVGTRLDLRPSAPLRASTRYTIEAVFAYDSGGIQVADTERLRADPATLRGAWFPVVFFRTAATAETARTIVPRIDVARVHFAMGGGDCGPAVGVQTDLALAALAPTDVLELRVQGMGVVETVPAAGTLRMFASDMLCNPDPVSLPARRTIPVQVALIDASGRELGVTGWTQARGEPHRPLNAAWSAHRRGPNNASPPWTAIRVGTVRPLADPGPTGCPYGLELAATAEITNGLGPWVYEAHSSLTSSSTAAFDVVSDSSGQTLAYRIRNDGTSTRIYAGTAGIPQIAQASADSLYFVGAIYDQQTSQQATTLHALGLDGRARWQARIAGSGGYFRLALGGGRVLSAWQQHDASYDNFAVWALHDAVSGRELLAPQVSAHQIHMNGGMASAFVRDRFFVAFPNERSDTQLLVITRDGSESAHRALGVPHDGPFDLVSMGTRAALVTSNDGDIAVTLLDAEGRIERGPTVVSTGIGGRDNRKPRAAWNGEVILVAWETNPSGHTFATVIDPAGHVAPALAFDRDRHTSTVGIAAVGRTFVGTYTLDPYEVPRTITTSMRCRTNAPAGAPQRVQR